MYYRKTGKQITTDEAKEVLNRVRRYLFALNFPEFYTGDQEILEPN
jgi:hypothetical protein